MGFEVGTASGRIQDAPIDGVAYGRQDVGWVPVVRLDGDFMTGPLVLAANPITPMEAVTKDYVDTRFTGATHFIGGINAATGICDYTVSSGIPDGPVVPAAQVPDAYLICTAAGTIPSGEAAGITMAEGDWLLSNGVEWHDLAVGGVVVAASQVAVNPPALGANNVQDALERALPLAGGTLTGVLYSRSASTTAATPGYYFRGSDNRNWGAIQATASGSIVGGQPEAMMRFYTMNGGWGWHQFMYTSVSSPVQTNWEGQLNAPNFNVTSDLVLKQDVSEPGLAEFARAFATLRPRKFRRRPIAEGEDQAFAAQPGRLEYGLIANEIDPVAVSTGDDGMKGYSLSDVLAIAIGKVHELEGRLARREQATLGARIGRASRATMGLWAAMVTRLVQISNELRTSFLGLLR